MHSTCLITIPDASFSLFLVGKEEYVRVEKHMLGTAPGRLPHYLLTLQKCSRRGFIYPPFREEVKEIWEGHVACSRSLSFSKRRKVFSRGGRIEMRAMNVPLYIAAF